MFNLVLNAKEITNAVLRLHRHAYNPVPCEPDVIRIAFNHNRKRTHESTSVTNVPGATVALKKEDPLQDYGGEDLGECGVNECEDRFRCLVAECGKRFRSNSGLRLHSRTTHGVMLKDGGGSGGQSNGNGSRTSSHSGAHPPPTVSPTKYAASRPYKCQQCSKRYKTTAGLSNHVEQSHKKQAGGCGTPSSTDSAPASPSPAVLDQLISQARAHGQATAAQEQQRAQQRPLPVQVASGSAHQYGQMSTQAPLPVRSLPNTHSRYGQAQNQVISSGSPNPAYQSNVENSSRVVAGAESEQGSRAYNAPHIAESGPILLPFKQE
ncbi:unnamed protein product [Nippostrongylus brasiliensis]|uniref:C2H2-type domain-containing protein n=1 Tax=Nippostrongylus brasiliensis TaxID=27835 RepID=A0A3P7D9S2_NIPBR|nr:unnamed protein product [Nippostrongylus brasiliensis]